MTSFDITKYGGRWYELMHYDSPMSWFQTSDNYNTTATYDLTSPTTMTVTNTTWTGGKPFTSVGSGKYLGGSSFRVDFPMPERMKIEKSGEFAPNIPDMDPNTPNYIIRHIFNGPKGDYMFVIVTNHDNSMLWVLSRVSNPPLTYYHSLMEYMVANYDKRKLIQTPHLK
jgi:lipocalin